MFCTNCGSENPDYGKVCVNCGAPLESADGVSAANGEPQAAPPNYPPDQTYQPVNTPRSGPFSEKMNTAVKSVSGAFSEAAGDVRRGDFKSLLGNKKFLILGGAVLALIVIIIIIVIAVASSSSGGGASADFAIPQNNIGKFLTEDNETVFFHNGKKLKTVIDGIAYIAGSTLDGGTAYAYTNDGELYIVTSADVKKIADECTSVYVADFGGSAYYVSDDALYFYNGSRSEEIADGAGFSSFKVSPNGSSCAWTEYDDGDMICRAYVKGRVQELDKVKQILSITDSGDVVFYTNDSGKLCCMKDLKESESVKSFGSVTALSADRRKILFTDGDGSRTYMFNASMSEAVKVCNNYISLLNPQYGKANYSDFDSFVAYDGDYYSGRIRRYIRKGDEYEVLDIVSANSGAVISDDGRYVLYMKNDKIYKKSTLSEDADKITVGKDVETVVADGCFNDIYCIDEDYALCYSDGKSENIVTVYDKDDVKYIASTASGVCVFIYDYSGGEGSLAYSVKGSERQKCGGLSSASSLFTDGTGKYIYAVDYDKNLYVSADGKSFTDTKTVVDDSYEYNYFSY